MEKTTGCGAANPGALAAWRAGLVATFLLCQGAGAATLTYCAPGSPDGFDIAQYETIVTNDASIPIYEQLLALKPGTTEVVPSLAERWQVSPDGLQVTLDLRRGVKFQTTPWFQPTREMNADDGLWSINRINDKQHPAHAAATHPTRATGVASRRWTSWCSPSRWTTAPGCSG